MDIEDLETQIKYYASKYYSGEPEVSDEYFDNLVDRLRQLNPNSSVLKTGWGFEVVGDKVKHIYGHVGSLDKTKKYDDIPERFKNKTIYISPKLDGLSAVAYYERGNLIMGITRGDGEYGRDITDKLHKIIGNNIADKNFTGAVRGEIIINSDNWDKLNKKYSNLVSPRNFAAGIINRKELDEDIQYLDLVVYKIVGQENSVSYKNREGVLQWLKLNFKNCIPVYYYPVLNKSSWDTYHRDTFEQFKKLGYGLDGLVLTNSDIQYLSHYENDHHLYNYIYDEVAFKFESETANVIVTDIEWNLTRTQKLVPVVCFEKCYLSGAEIQRATGFNAKFILDNKIKVGSEIKVCRSGEVIPYICVD